MRKMIILVTGLIFLTINVSCSSNKSRVTMDATPIKNQNKSFIRGGIKLSSEDNKVELTVVDYSFNAMIVALSIANDNGESVVFSDKNLKIEHFSSNGNYQAKVSSYNELLNQYTESGRSAIGKIGSTAVNIGSRFIPFGGEVVSLGKLLYSLAQQGVSHEDRIDRVVASQLDKMYLRQHTVEADKKYGGLVKVTFTEELKQGDRLLFNISMGKRQESFTFICK